MGSNGVQEMNQLGGSGGTIRLALDALKEKKGSVDQVRHPPLQLPLHTYYCNSIGWKETAVSKARETGTEPT